MLFSLSHRVLVFLQPNSLLKPLPHSCPSLKYTNGEERQIDQIISETYKPRQTDISKEEESRGIVVGKVPLTRGMW